MTHRRGREAAKLWDRRKVKKEVSWDKGRTREEEARANNSALLLICIGLYGIATYT